MYPHTIVLPNGDTLEGLADTGTYKITDMAGHFKGYTHSVEVVYKPTLAEQLVASKENQP